MARLTKYQKAKKEWFNRNIIDFAVTYYDRNTNSTIVKYSLLNGSEDLDIRLYNCYLDETKQFAVSLIGLEPWQVYFKSRQYKCNNDLRQVHVLVFDECRRNEKCLK